MNELPETKPCTTVTMMRFTDAGKQDDENRVRWCHSEPPISSDEQNELSKIVLSSLSLSNAFSTTISTKTPSPSPSPPSVTSISTFASTSSSMSRCRVEVHCMHDTSRIIVAMPCTQTDWYLLGGPSGHITLSMLKQLRRIADALIILQENNNNNNNNGNEKGFLDDKVEILWKSICFSSRKIHGEGKGIYAREKRCEFITSCLHDALKTSLRRIGNTKLHMDDDHHHNHGRTRREIKINGETSSIKLPQIDYNVTSLGTDNNYVQSFHNSCAHLVDGKINVCIISPGNTVTYASSQQRDDGQAYGIIVHQADQDKDEEDEEGNRIILQEGMAVGWFFHWLVSAHAKWNGRDGFLENVGNNSVCFSFKWQNWTLFALAHTSQVRDLHAWHSRQEVEALRNDAHQLLQFVSKFEIR